MLADVLHLGLGDVHGGEDRVGEEHLARLRQRLEARGEVQRLAEDVAPHDAHLASGERHAHRNALVLRRPLVVQKKPVLEGRAAEDGVGGRGEGDEEGVADVL